MSFLQPYALTLTTPAEMLPWGWTTTDLWAAPFITGLYALLTHAQPFWADAHAVALGWLGTSASEIAKVQPVDAEYARAVRLGVDGVVLQAHGAVLQQTKGKACRGTQDEGAVMGEVDIHNGRTRQGSVDCKPYDGSYIDKS